MLKIDTQFVDSKYYLGVWMSKISVLRDDFRLNMSARINNFAAASLAKESIIFKKDRPRGWRQYQELDSLFNDTFRFVDEDGTMKLFVEASF